MFPMADSAEYMKTKVGAYARRGNVPEGAGAFPMPRNEVGADHEGSLVIVRANDFYFVSVAGSRALVPPLFPSPAIVIARNTFRARQLCYTDNESRLTKESLSKGITGYGPCPTSLTAPLPCYRLSSSPPPSPTSPAAVPGPS